MILPDRLEEIFKLIPKNALVADIGADHAYLSIALAEKKNCQVYVVENKKSPLICAEKNIHNSESASKMVLLNSDGLIELGLIPHIIIAGMGGTSICRILKNSLDKLFFGQYLYLQPNTAEKRVRILLNELGYTIIKEIIVQDKNQIYEVIIAKKEDKKNKYSDLDYEFGPLLRQEKKTLFLRKWQKNLEKQRQILNGLDEHYTQFAKVANYIKKIESVIYED